MDKREQAQALRPNGITVDIRIAQVETDEGVVAVNHAVKIEGALIGNCHTLELAHEMAQNNKYTRGAKKYGLPVTVRVVKLRPRRKCVTF